MGSFILPNLHSHTFPFNLGYNIESALSNSRGAEYETLLNSIKVKKKINMIRIIRRIITINQKLLFFLNF